MGAVVLQGNEIIWVQGIAEDGYPSPVLEQTTTLAIANLGGNGGLSTEIDVSVGDTVNATLGSIVMFNSSSGTPKTVNAPAATGSLAIIEMVDVFGDAYTNPITFVPAGGGGVIGNQDQVYTDNGSARFRDTTLGWANV